MCATSSARHLGGPPYPSAGNLHVSHLVQFEHIELHSVENQVAKISPQDEQRFVDSEAKISIFQSLRSKEESAPITYIRHKSASLPLMNRIQGLAVERVP